MWIERSISAHLQELARSFPVIVLVGPRQLTERPALRDASGIDRLRAFYGAETVAAAYVACTTEQPHEIAPGVIARPGWTAWDV